MSTVNLIRKWTEYFDEFTNVLIAGKELGEMRDTISTSYAQTAANYMSGRLITCAKNGEVEFAEHLELSNKLFAIMMKCQVPVENASFESLTRCINDDKAIKKKVFVNDIQFCDGVQVGIVRAQADILYGKLCMFANEGKCSGEDFIQLQKKIVKLKQNCDFADQVVLYVLGKFGSEGVHPAALYLKEKIAQLPNLELEKAKEKSKSYMEKLKCFEQGVELNEETLECVNSMRLQLEIGNRPTQLIPSAEVIVEEVLPKSPVKLIELGSWDVYNFANELHCIANANLPEKDKLQQIGSALSNEIYHMKTSVTLSAKSPVSLQDMLESHLKRIAPNGNPSLADYGRAFQCVRVEALLVMLGEYLGDEDHHNTVSVSNVLERAELDPRDLPEGLNNPVHALHDEIYIACKIQSNENSQDNIDPNHWKFNYKFGRIALCGTHEPSVSDVLILHRRNEDSVNVNEKGKEEINQVVIDEGVNNVQIEIEEAVGEPVNNDPFHPGNVQKVVSAEIKLKALDEVHQAFAKKWYT